MVYCLTKLSTDDAVDVALACSFACGCLYPWNAKWRDGVRFARKIRPRHRTVS